MIYDSRVGFIELKAVFLKDMIESGEIDKLIAFY